MTPAAWQRECERSARRSLERREARSVHPWPERGHRLATFLVVAVILAVGLWGINYIGWVLS